VLVALFPSRFLSLERNKVKKDADIETLGMMSAGSLEKSKMEWVKKEEELKMEKAITMLPGNPPIKHDNPSMFCFPCKIDKTC